LDVVAAKNFHAARGSAGNEAGTAADEAAEIDGMKAVDVLGRIDGFEDALGVHLWRKRELDEDAVNVIIAVEILDDGEEIKSAGGGRRREEGAGKADFRAGGDFAFDIELRCGVFSYKDSGEAGTNTGCSENADFVFQFGENLVADFCAIEDARGHERLAFVERKGIIA
jgi:hypothetical protein